MSHLETRVRELERANRRLRLAAVGIVGVAAAALTMGGASKAEPEVIRARRFEVISDNGAVVAVLTASDGGGSEELLDAKGRRLLTAGSAKDHHGDQAGVISVFGNGGKELVRLSSSDTDVGTVRTLDSDGKELVKLATMTEEGVNKGCGAVIVADPTRQTLPGILTTNAIRRLR